jgi:hypothetical protein
MIINPEWLKPKEKPYFHQISLDCIEKLVKYIEQYHNGMEAVITLKTKIIVEGKETNLTCNKLLIII